MPLWQQVKLSLRDAIRKGDLSPHDQLPSEAELCAAYSVSRTVVREALGQLANEGLIYRQQGKGAFVRGYREVQDFASTTVGFSGELEEKRHTVSRRILRQDVILPTPRMRRFMQIDSKEPVIVIDRVMSVDGRPRAIVRWAMVASAAPGLEAIPLANQSLYDTISREYGIRLVHAERWIEAVSLSPADAHLLQVTEGTAVLCVESVASSQTHANVEYYTAHYLTEHSRLHFVVRDNT